MDAVIVYEFLWGNTAAVARAVAEGFGPGARAPRPTRRRRPSWPHADVLVVGAPVIAFGLASDKTRRHRSARQARRQPARRRPPIGQVLARVAAGRPRVRRRLRDPPLVVAARRDRHDRNGLRAAGYRIVEKAEKFVVAGWYGPLRDGEASTAPGPGQVVGRARGSERRGRRNGFLGVGLTPATLTGPVRPPRPGRPAPAAPASWRAVRPASPEISDGRPCPSLAKCGANRPSVRANVRKSMASPSGSVAQSA